MKRRPMSLVVALAALVACDRNIPTSPRMPTGPSVGAGSSMSAADSAAALALRSSAGTTTSSTGVTSISVPEGASVTIRVTSTECSGNPETVKVYGVISGVVVAGSCAGGLTGRVVTMGPASVAGTVYFTATHQVFGEGPAGEVSGTDPDYSVGMNDGFGDTDFDDVIINVHVGICPPVGDQYLLHHELP